MECFLLVHPVYKFKGVTEHSQNDVHNDLIKLFCSIWPIFALMTSLMHIGPICIKEVIKANIS